jgi:hypothetical protein
MERKMKMNRLLITSGLYAALPLVCLTAAAGTKQVWTSFGATGTALSVPNNAVFVACGVSGKPRIEALSFAANDDGTPSEPSTGLEPCQTAENFTTGTTIASGTLTSCQNETKHRVQLMENFINQSRVQVVQSGFAPDGQPASNSWDFNQNTGQGVTTASATMRAQFTTNGGSSWSPCDTVTFNVASLGTGG